MVAPHVKALRVSMTDAERKLWRALRARAIGVKFRRQVPLGPYVVDFVCFERRLIIEVDGGQHADCQRDRTRDDYFAKHGFRTIRFWNNDVMSNIEGVMIALTASLSPSPGAPRDGAPPSPAEGRGETGRVAT